jgi:hypothetical protein
MDRQHTYTSLSSSLPMNTTLLDTKGIGTFFSYNLSKNWINKESNILNINRLDYVGSQKNNELSESLLTNLVKIIPNKTTLFNTLDFNCFINTPNMFSVMDAENDSKQHSNNFKYVLNNKHKKKSIYNFNFLTNNFININNNVDTMNPTILFNSTIFNTENTLKFKDYKSSNAQFLGSERTVRLLNNVNSNMFK